MICPSLSFIATANAIRHAGATPIFADVDEALKELTGHYVNYRKQVSSSMQELLPEQHFRLYAVSARFPQNLAHHQAAWTTIGP